MLTSRQNVHAIVQYTVMNYRTSSRAYVCAEIAIDNNIAVACFFQKRQARRQDDEASNLLPIATINVSKFSTFNIGLGALLLSCFHATISI